MNYAEEISSSSISKIVSSVRSSMMELTIATAEVRSSQTLQRANSEQQMHKSGSYGNIVNRMPSFGASVGSVEQDEPAEIASRGGDSALINLIQKYTKDKAAQQYILSVWSTPAGFCFCLYTVFVTCVLCTCGFSSLRLRDASRTGADADSVIMHHRYAASTISTRRNR